MASPLWPIQAAAAIGAVVYMTKKGNEILARSKGPTGDPNQIINPKAPIDPHDVVPTCQYWDETYQLFIPVGKYTDSSQDCFTNANTYLGFPQNSPLRYVGTDLKPVFNGDWDENGGSAGTCLLVDDNGVLNALPGYAAINNNARMCFNSGDTPQASGWAFINTNTVNNQTFTGAEWNPDLRLDDITALFTTGKGAAQNMANYPWAMPTGVEGSGFTVGEVPFDPSIPTWCEEQVVTVNTSNLVNGLETFQTYWVHDQSAHMYDLDMTGCLTQGPNGVPRRFVNPPQNALVYWDPTTKSPVQRNLNNNL